MLKNFDKRTPYFIISVEDKKVAYFFLFMQVLLTLCYMNRMISINIVCLIFFVSFSNAWNNGLGRTPQMGELQGFFIIFYAFLIQGWNSWYPFRCNYTETMVKQMADAIASTPLAAAGYQYGMFSSLVFPIHCSFLSLLYSQLG